MSRHSKVHRGFRSGAALAAVLAVAWIPALAQATYIEQTVNTGGIMGQPPTEATQKIWVGDGVYCIQDPANGVVSVFDTETGSLTVINKSDKSYTVTTKEQLQGLAQMGTQMLEQLGQGQKVEVSVNKTGNTAKVGEWNAYEVVAEIKGPVAITMTMWLSKDAPLDMQAWSEMAEMLQVQGMLGDAMDKLAAFEGYPVKQESRTKMMGIEMTSTTEVTAIRRQPVNKAVCSVPAGFTKQEGMLPMSGFGSPPGQP